MLKVGKKGTVDIVLMGMKLQQVEAFKKLGNLETWSGSRNEQCRTTIGKGVFKKVWIVITAQKIPRDLRNRSAKCLV